MNDLTTQDFCTIGEEILNKSGKVSGTFHFHQQWTSAFLVDPVIVAEVWNRLKLHEYEEEEWMRAARPVTRASAVGNLLPQTVPNRKQNGRQVQMP